MIGIDIGGTEIKGGFFSAEDGRMLGKRAVATSDGDGLWLDRVRGMCAELETEFGKAEHVGISAPGLASADGSCIEFMPGRLAGIERLDFTAALGCAQAVPVINDAHAAILGEIWQGSAKGLRDVVMITLGTGVGGAIVSGGNLLKGRIGRAGHLGHMTVDYLGTPDICGTPGSLEDAIGNATIGLRSGGRFSTTHELVAAFADGDSEAEAVWLKSLKALSAAIVSLINVVDPEAVIIGGGIARAGEHLFAPLRKMMADQEWKPAGHQVRILPAELGEWAGCYGAASLQK
jgi:glucokinase